MNKPIENRVYYSRAEIQKLIALDMGLEPGPDIQVEWNDDHSAVILVPEEPEWESEP